MVDVIEQTQNKEADNRHSPKPLIETNQIKWLKSILDPVYPLTVDEWQGLLMRENNPRYQLAWWIGFAKVYRSMTAELPPEKCKKIFENLLGSDRDRRRTTSDMEK